MLNFIKSLALFSLTANGLLKQDEQPLPRNTRTIRVEGQSQAEHTTDSHGRFKHPFLHQSSDVQSIYYADEGRYSTKLHRKPGHSRHSHQKKNQSDRALSKSGHNQSTVLSYLEFFL